VASLLQTAGFKQILFFINAGVNQLANTRSDVTIQGGKTRRGINKELASDLDSGNYENTRFILIYQLSTQKKINKFNDIIPSNDM
jgi:hypothetical protein